MTNETLPRPQPLRMDNAFAHDTMKVRVPGILADVRRANEHYSPAVLDALDRLRDALMTDKPILPLDSLPVPALDHAMWAAAYQEQQRESSAPLSWLHAEWFFAETYVNRVLMQIIRWFETGHDPFAATKRAEAASRRFDDMLRTALAVDQPYAEKLATFLSFSLWGNRVDLSHPAGGLSSQDPGSEDLLVDDRDAVVAYLESVQARPEGGTVHIIQDNAGTELAMDLMLADVLLSVPGQTVVLHVKYHPTYVSDTTIPDVWHVLDIIAKAGMAGAAVVARLRHAWQAGRLRFAADPFWTSSRFLWDVPAPLYEAFRHAQLVILKGDVNYRRATGDGFWPAGTTFAGVMAYVPCPVLALRSIKSDVVVGLPPEVEARLDTASPGWRTTGRYGLVQFAGK